jgi:hypothetical protein
MYTPERIKSLPFDERTKHHVPWFVADAPEGRERDFRIIDHNKRVRAVNKSLCWICGQRLGQFKAYVIGPMCLVNRITSEPPSHLECAQYAVMLCPFLSNPRMRRSPRPLPAESLQPVGEHIDRNPGVSVIFVTKQPPKILRVDDGFLFTLPERYESLELWALGRPATEAEVQASIAAGMPLLAAAAFREGPRAEKALLVQAAETDALLAQHFARAARVKGSIEG